MARAKKRPVRQSTSVTPKAAERKAKSAARGRSAPAPAPEDDPRRSVARRAELDDADRRLIELLSVNGRLSNRALAAEVGLTEATIGARLRSLADRRVLAVTATLDWRAAGYCWDAWLQISVEGRSVREVGEELALVDGVHVVHVLFGPRDLIVHVLLPDEHGVVDFLAERVGAVEGVHVVRPNVVLETVKFETKHARIPIRPMQLRFPGPTVELDELDCAVIDALVADGRQSNREVARNLQVSEGTVRARLRRLEEAGLLRITARSDPYMTGEVSAWAIIGIDVALGSVREVSERLRALPETTIVAVVAGSHDILVAVATPSRSRLVDLVVEDIRQLSGVRATTTFEVVHTPALSYQWARLLDG